MRWVLLTLGLATIATFAARADVPAVVEAQVWSVSYEVSLGGARVGAREVTVRERGPRRFVESLTKVSAPAGVWGQRATAVCGGLGSLSSFTEMGDAAVRLQAREERGGRWKILVEGGSERGVDAYTSTLALHDPTTARVLATPGPLALVVVETGDVLSGTVEAGVDAVISVGPEKVRVTRYVVRGAAGAATFDLDAESVLLRAEVPTPLGALVLTARAAPPPRSYGETPTIEAIGGGLREESL